MFAWQEALMKYKYANINYNGSLIMFRLVNILEVIFYGFLFVHDLHLHYFIMNMLGDFIQNIC